jgi:hypothetical protein
MRELTHLKSLPDPESPPPLFARLRLATLTLSW